MDCKDYEKSQIIKLTKMSKSIQTNPIIVTSSENRLNTDEKLNEFFMEVYEKEIEVNKVNESDVLDAVSKLPSTIIPTASERCCYLYCYATCHTLLVKDCITRFLDDYSNSADLIDSLRSKLNITSLSFGPCLDCIAFNLAFLEYSKDPTVVSNVSIIVAYSQSWLRTIETLSEVFQEVKTPLNINYLTHKVYLRDMFNVKEQLFLQNSNVALMFHPFSTKEHMEKYRFRISEFIKTLKNGALLFSIYHPILTSEMRSILCVHQGSFLHGPVVVHSPETVIEVAGDSMKSIPSTSFQFFVWVKGFDPLDSKRLSQPLNMLNENDLLTSTNHGEPPKKITILRYGLKEVKMFYSFHADRMQESNSLLKSKGTQTDLVSKTVLENKLNKNKLVTDFFMEVFKRQVAQFNVRESVDLLSNVLKLSSSGRNFDDPKSICGYMYYYAPCHTLLIKECLVRFLTDYPNTQNLLAKWRSKPYSYCSLSQGPGLDYIGFSLAVLEVSKQPIANILARIVTTHDNWKCTVDILSEVIQRVKTPLNLKFDLKFFHHQDLSEVGTSKTIKLFKFSSVVFMFKTLNLIENKESGNCPLSILGEMVKLLSPGTIVFFMDSAASSAVMREALEVFNGTFLYPPMLVISKNFQIEVSEELKKSMQLPPAQIAEVEFFVWEKISNPPPTPTECPQESGKKLTTSNSEGEIEQISVGAEKSTEVPRKSKSAANNSFELDSSKPLIVPINRRSTFSSSNSASTEFPHVFKPVAAENSATNILSDNQLNGIMTGIPPNSAGIQISNESMASNSSIPNNYLSKPDQCSTDSPSSAEELWPNATNVKHLQDFSSFLDLSLTCKRIDVSTQDRPPIIDFLMWLFMEVYEKEIKKYKANQFLSLTTVFELSSSTFSANYKDAHIRCAYMYRYATCHTLLIKGCIARFLSEYSDAGKLLNIWKANPFFCSLSLGPGLDYIAFRLAVLEHTQLPFQVIKVRIVTSCTEWKSTVDILSEVMQVRKVMPDLKLDSSRVLNGSVFEQWPSKAKKYLQKSSLIFMFKSLNLEVKERDVDTRFLLELVNVLKPRTVILFIDTLYSSFVMQNVLAKCPGTYLYGPVLVACNNIPIGKPEQMKTVLGVIPVQSDQAHFFVWKKDPNTLNPSKNHRELKQNGISSEIKSNRFESSGSSTKLLQHEKSPTQFQKVVSSPNTTNVSFTSSSRCPPTLNWRVKQEDSPHKPSSFSVKVENKHKIRDYLSGSQNSDIFKMSALSDQSRPSLDSTSFSPSGKGPDPRETVRPVDHKSSIKSKVSTDSSCIFTSPDIVNSNFKCGVIDSIARIIKPEVSADSSCLFSNVNVKNSDFDCDTIESIAPFIKSKASTDSSCIFSNANVDNSDFDCDTIEPIAPFIKSKVSTGSSCKPASSCVLVSDFECGAVEPLTSIVKSKVPMDSSCKASGGNVVNGDFECGAVDPIASIIKSEACTNSSCLFTNADVDKRDFECDAVEPMSLFIKSEVSTNSSWKPSIGNIYSHFNCDAIEPIAPIDCESTRESHRSFLGSANSEPYLVSKLSSEIVGTKEILSNNQVTKINSLIERIDKLASSIKNDDYHAPSKMRKKEESVSIMEINNLTKRINQVVSILESNISNQTQNSIS